MPKISENIKLIVKSVLPLTIVIILFVVVGPFGVSKVSDIQDQINLLENNKTVLTQKLNLLQTLSTTVSQDSGTALSALPSTNVSLEALSQVKNISSRDGIIISAIKVGSEVVDSSGTSHVGISFQVTGERSQVLTFLEDIANMAPLTLVDKIKITGTGVSETADVTLQSYWSPLPKTLPTLNTPITDLTTAEKDILTNLGSLTQPTFSVVPPSDGAGKTNPFNQ